MEIKVKINETKEIGESLINISKEVDSLIEELFTKINKLQTEGAWQGISATKYFEKISNDKEELKKVSDALNKYGEFINTSSSKLEVAAKECQY